jgi:hypothetical protein
MQESDLRCFILLSELSDSSRIYMSGSSYLSTARFQQKSSLKYISRAYRRDRHKREEIGQRASWSLRAIAAPRLRPCVTLAYIAIWVRPGFRTQIHYDIHTPCIKMMKFIGTSQACLVRFRAYQDTILVDPCR